MAVYFKIRETFHMLRKVVQENPLIINTSLVIFSFVRTEI
jgi:hypothetical protein